MKDQSELSTNSLFITKQKFLASKVESGSKKQSELDEPSKPKQKLKSLNMFQKMDQSN